MRTLPASAAALLGLAACSSPPSPPPAAPPPPAASSVAAPAPPPPTPTPVGPPVAAVKEVHDSYFGSDIVDPYRWMESDSPDFAQWMKGQADYTRAALDKISIRGELFARIHADNNAGAAVGGVDSFGGKLFYLKADPGKDTFKLYTREGAKGAERILVDPDKLATQDRHFSIDGYFPSNDGRLVACVLSPSGSEVGAIHIIDVATGKDLPDVIDRARYPNISWQPDGRSFFYRRLRKLPADAPASERLIKQHVFLHVLGTDPEKDKPSFGEGVFPSIEVHDDAFPFIISPLDGDYLIGGIDHGVRDEQTLYLAPRRSFAAEKTPWKKIADPDADEVIAYEVRGGDLYFLSRHQAPHGKLLRVSLKKPDVAHAAVVLPEGDAVLHDFALAEDAIYVNLMDGGLSRVRRIPYDGGAPTEVALPFQGSIGGLSGQVKEPGVYFRITGWARSAEIDYYNPKAKKVEDTGVYPPWPADFSKIIAVETKAKSQDGTMVPLSIVARRDLAKDGSHPTLLQGYGAYGNIRRPDFDPTTLAWLDRGGVFAICHPRGGGEYGEEWHRGGKLATKPNTIHDFIGCAQALIDAKYTSPPHLAGEGVSAGGILIGGAITARPDLFGAAIVRVGMTNALRFEQIPIGPFNTSEFGTVTTQEGFRMLMAIDAYHHVKKGTAYPAVLLTTGITDPRVSPWQAAKMTARLQAATSSHKPVLLRVDYEAGHGIGSTKSQWEAERADIYAFLTQELGGTP